MLSSRSVCWNMNSKVRCILALMLISGFCVMLLVRETSAQGCKNVIFLLKKTDRYLRNHIIETLITLQSTCSSTCYLIDSCLSYNFHESTGTCDINDSDEFQHPEDLIARPGYVYVGTKNACKNKPCPSNAICKADFYNGGFKCLCIKGHTGPNCSPVITALGSRERPAKSCLDILNHGFSNGSGVYVLDPTNTGNPIKAYCDMTTDGGGWTKVKRLYLNTPFPSRTAVHLSYKVLAQYNNNNEDVLLTTSAMLDIHEKMGFRQIHFYCYKKSVGRVVSIMTKNNTAGYDVVSFFINRKEPVKDFPTACGSFDRLPEDTSILAQSCSLWGKLENSAIEVNKWGSYNNRYSYRISNYPFGIDGKNVAFSFSQGYWCDDRSTQAHMNDTWQISVR